MSTRTSPGRGSGLLAIFLLLAGVLTAQEDADIGVAPVTFSLPDRIFTETFVLELHSDAEGAEIRYSTDGNPLTIFNSRTYQEPLEIADTTWIRARAITADGSSAVTSGHYIRLAEDLRDFDSPLPILVLENFGQGAVPSKNWNQTGAGVKQVERQRAQWFLFDRGGAGRSRLAGEPAESSRLGVRVRGAFSSSFPRKPFSVEAWDEDDASTNIEPLGLPAESDWILYAPNAVQDQTLLYNTWLYALSRSIGGNAMRFRFTEAFVHTDGGPLSRDDHAGVYVIMEKVKRDRNRLDFPRLSEDGAEGGWLLSINRMDPIPVAGFPAPNGAMTPQFFHTAGPNRVLQTPPNQAGRGDDIPRQSNAFLNFESPNGFVINAPQRAAIEGWFEEFEDVLYGEDFRDPQSGYTRYLDVDNFIDYFILHDLTRNTDGLLISMWVYKEGPAAKLKMGPVWDYDLAYRGSATSDLGINRNRLWYTRLWEDPDFEQQYGDRWQALRSGPLSDAAIHALIDGQAAEITEPVALAHGISNWPSRLATWKKWIADRANAIDKKFEPRPTLSQASGRVERGMEVRLKAGSIFAPRVIFYTTDGADPRTPGGAVAASAILFESGIIVGESTRLRARVLHEDVWSGPIEGRYFVGEEPASSANIEISKIHYHPANPSEAERAAGFLDADAFEFLELRNTAEQPIHLGGARFSDGIAFQFEGASGRQVLAPRERLLIVQNRKAFAARYGEGFPVAGVYAGRLRNSGERLRMIDYEGVVIAEVTYNDRRPWPEAADGEGPSLVRMEGASIENAFAWRPSVALDGAPGVDDQLAFAGDPLGDEDGDGLSNLLEFALGTMGREDAQGSVLAVEDQGSRIRVRHRRALGAGGIQLSVEFSKDLVEWQAVPGLEPVDRVYGKDGSVEEWLEMDRAERANYLRLRAAVR